MSCQIWPKAQKGDVMVQRKSLISNFNATKKAVLASKISATVTPGSTKVAPSKFAPSKLAPSKIAPTKLAPSKIAPTKLAPSKIAPTKLAPSKIAPTKLAPSKIAPRMM
jgi:hypothetical protein